MAEQIQINIRQALYVAVINKLLGELSELEAKEILLVNNPVYITSKDHDHADHIEELKNIVIKKHELREVIQSLRETHFKPQSPPKDGKDS
tara:strand:- start:483 stop:755 length:273 start_codon:yes stop_codon:yes gene_type:complete